MEVEQKMGLGPPILALYRQLKGLGAFAGVQDVMELGAQAVWCPRAELVRDLFRAFDKPEPSQEMLDRFANWKGSGRELYLALGFTYNCVDLDPNFDSIRLDLNFDGCPPKHAGKYHFVTNHGTSEHLLNQYNFFKIMHDLTAAGGLMIHAVPFTAHIDHGFFNYQPNFFEALARYNSYRLYGIWVSPGWQAASLIPWEKDLLDYMVINSQTTHLLVVLVQKMYDREFCIPFQGIYEDAIPEDALARYSMIVDGEAYDGKRVKHLTTDGIVAERIAHETLVIRNELASVHGQYWDVASRLSAAEARIENELDPLKQELAASLLRFETLRQKLENDQVENRKITNEIRENDKKLAESAPIENTEMAATLNVSTDAIVTINDDQHAPVVGAMVYEDVSRKVNPDLATSIATEPILRNYSGRELLSEVGFRVRRRLLGSRPLSTKLH